MIKDYHTEFVYLYWIEDRLIELNTNIFGTNNIEKNGIFFYVIAIKREIGFITIIIILLMLFDCIEDSRL